MLLYTDAGCTSGGFTRCAVTFTSSQLLGGSKHDQKQTVSTFIIICVIMTLKSLFIKKSAIKSLMFKMNVTNYTNNGKKTVSCSLSSNESPSSY